MTSALALRLAIAWVFAGIGAAVAADGLVPVAVTATPMPAFLLEPGTNLEYRGGLVLSSPDRSFGSWSGLDFSLDGSTLYAIADDGRWLSLKLTETGGRLVGVSAARMAPLLDDAGVVIRRKIAADAEGLRIVRRDGIETALVSFEQVPDIRVFAGPDFATAKPRHLPVPKTLDAMDDNRGLEAIAVAPATGPIAGATLVIAEHYLDKNGNHRGYVLDGPRIGPITLRRTDNFDVSDAAFLPNGDLLVLERKFAILDGFAMRLRRVPVASFGAGSVLDGQIVLQADAALGVDNMEGLAVRGQPDGSALVSIISDDNHSFLERTILLEFALKAPQPLRPRLRPDDVAIE